MTRRVLGRSMLAAGIAALPALLLAFAPVGGALAQRRGGTLVYATLSGAGTMDPHVASAIVELEMIHHVYEALVEMGETYNATPMLASKVEASPDAKTFTFTLRRGVRFSNGKEMTSADVLASFERYKRVSPNAAALADVRAMEAPDPYTFVISLNNPNAVFVEVLKTPTYPFSIIPAEQRDKPARELDVIGTGPYQLAEWVKEDHLLFRRFEGYAPVEAASGPDGYAGRKTAYLDAIRYNIVPEANARVAALQAGGADFIATIPPDVAKRLDGRPGISVMRVIPYCQQEFILHSQNPPTNNPAIRQAIAAVVDVDEILTASGQIAERNHSLMFRTSPYFPGAATASWYDLKNVERAKQALRAAGYGGERIVLETNANYPYMRDAILVLAEQLKAAGVNAEVKMVDWNTNVTDMNKGSGGWHVTTTGFCSGPLLGPQQWRPLLIGFPQIQGDAVLDDAYKRFFLTPDLEQRKAIWVEIEKRVLEQAYMIKVADIAELRGYNGRFENHRPYYMQRFWDVWLK